jgi:hypothetical protein
LQSALPHVQQNLLATTQWVGLHTPVTMVSVLATPTAGVIQTLTVTVTLTAIVTLTLTTMEVTVAGETSRRNGAKSRGPRTAQGKARSSTNARRHGLSALLNDRPIRLHVERIGLGLARAIMGRTVAVCRSTTGCDGDAIPVELLQASIEFVHANDLIQHCHAIKMLAVEGAFAFATFKRVQDDAWSDLIDACIDNSTGSGSASTLFAARDIAQLCADRDLANADALVQDMQIARRHRLSLMLSSTLDDKAAATAACAPDHAVVDRYEKRANVRRRKALKVLRRYRAAGADADVCANGADLAEVHASVPSVVCGNQWSSIDLPPLYKTSPFDPSRTRLRSAAKSKTLPHLNAFGQEIPGLEGLQLALMARYADLTHAILAIERSNGAAIGLHHYALARRHLSAAKAALRQRDAFAKAAFAILRISSFAEVFLDLRRKLLERGSSNDLEAVRALDAVLSRLWRVKEDGREHEGEGRGEDLRQDDEDQASTPRDTEVSDRNNKKNGTNEPEGHAAEGAHEASTYFETGVGTGLAGTPCKGSAINPGSSGAHPCETGREADCGRHTKNLQNEPATSLPERRGDGRAKGRKMPMRARPPKADDNQQNRRAGRARSLMGLETPNLPAPGIGTFDDPVIPQARLQLEERMAPTTVRTIRIDHRERPLIPPPWWRGGRR